MHSRQVRAPASSQAVSYTHLDVYKRQLPFFFLGMYERDGQPLEKIAKQFILAKFVRPKVRPYQTNNYYAVLIRQAQAEMEVNHIVYGEKSVPKNRKKKPEHAEESD